MVRLIKVVLSIVAVLAVVLAVVLVGGGLMLSPTFTVTRSADIAAPPDKVYALVANPREWGRWAVWHQRDPAMKIEYSGAASGAGAGWSWKSASEGDGKMTFTAAEPGKRVAYDLFFPDFGTTSNGDLLLMPEGGGTKVTWTMNGNMGSSPLLRWMALFGDKMVGPDCDAGLANLKAVSERR
jgi:uncharacterized protein YndB with AHSA1/START domain